MVRSYPLMQGNVNTNECPNTCFVCKLSLSTPPFSFSLLSFETSLNYRQRALTPWVNSTVHLLPHCLFMPQYLNVCSVTPLHLSSLPSSVIFFVAYYCCCYCCRRGRQFSFLPVSNTMTSSNRTNCTCTSLYQSLV